MWYAFTNWFVKLTGGLPYFFGCRPKTYFEDKSVQSARIKGKAIIVSNHKSVFDVAIMMFVFWRRTLRCIVAELMFRKNPFLTFFLKAIGGIKVERNAHDFAFMEKSLEILDKGGVVEIYPESRIPNEGEETPLPFKPSTAYIALRSGAPIIPVYTNGNFFGKERTRVIIGTPIDAQALYNENLTEKENLQNVTEYLRNRIVELSHELERQIANETKKEEKAQ